MSDSGKAVFLSYASQDADAARRIADALRAFGVEVWFDQEELRGGDEWDAKIRRQVKTCALFMPVISANTQKRSEGYFRREWNLATQRVLDMAPGKSFLLPVVIDGTKEENAVVADEFLRVQWTHLSNNEVPPAFVKRVKSLLEAESMPAPRDEVPLPLTVGSAGASDATTPNRRMKWLGASILVLLSVAILGALVWRFWPASPKSSVAILPFEDLSPQKDQAWFCDGMTDELINRLSNISELKVSARTSVFWLKSKQQDIREIGKMLGVATVLEGSIQKVETQIRARMQLVSAADGHQLWSEVFQREVKDVFALQDEIALTVVAKLKLTLLGDEKVRLAKRRPVDPAAYEAYLKGLNYWWQWSEDGLNNALSHFRRAIEIVPDYAPAHAGMALVYINGGGWMDVWRPRDTVPLGLEFAQKAIQLDPTLADGYAARGWARMNFDWDWANAAKDCKKAVELNPNSVLALDTYANFLMVSGSPSGSLAEALAVEKRAIELDPLSAGLHHNFGWAEGWVSGKFDRAIPHLRKALELDPKFYNSRLLLAFSLHLSGKSAEAAVEFDALARLAPDVPIAQGAVGYFHAVSGRPEEAKKVLAGLDQMAGARYVAPWARAIVYIGLGQSSLALDWLEKGVEEHDGWMWTLPCDPFYATLSGEPRFQTLVKRVRPNK